jgi:uncharacterized protein YqfA (UPF0365 family)
MLLFAQGDPDARTMIIIGITVVILVVLLVIFSVLARYFRLWIQSVLTNAGISIWDLLGMTFRKVNPAVIVRSKIMAVQAGINEDSGVTSKALEAHYLAGGNVPLIIRALIAAQKAKTIQLSFREATAIDLAGRNVLEAVQTSVYPKVIDCPAKGSGKATLDAVAKDGIQLKVKARVTVRANLQQLIGGATEETITARVGEGIVSAIGSAETHAMVLENPDMISRAVLERKLDSQTAFKIVSIDIADIDVGDNIGARLQADQAEADTRVARARAEGRRAMAVAHEQEKSPVSKRAAPSWSRPKPRCPRRSPKPFTTASWASWTTTSCGISRRTRTCAKRSRRVRRPEEARHNHAERTGKPAG